VGAGDPRGEDQRAVGSAGGSTPSFSTDDLDEHATCYIVKGRGLMVISCGHTGIINTVRSAMKSANVDKAVYSNVGSRHTFGA
jgi:metal-dependent hydrolase (beta-lactamase superfamily II)